MENNLEDQVNESKEKGLTTKSWDKIIIKPEAFKKMIFHILRFGNSFLETPVEAMGVCLGEQENNEKNVLIVKECIPLTHGDYIELGLSRELEALLDKIKMEHSNESLRIIGWYISHPKYDLKLTSADIQIHRYFQNDNFPNAFCLTFDPIKVEKKSIFSFQAYRFKDHDKHDELIEINCQLEPPKTLEFFKWVQHLVESIQRKDQILIHEYGEHVKPPQGDLQEIPLQKKEMVEQDIVEIENKIQSLSKGITDGTMAFVNSFAQPFNKQLEQWLIDVEEGSIKGSRYLKSSINQLKTTINNGLEGLQNYFEKKFNEISNVFVSSISESLDNSLKEQENYRKFIESELESLLLKINDDINSQFDKISNTFERILDAISSKINQNSEKIRNLEGEINSNGEQVKACENKVKEFHEVILDSLSTNFNSTEDNLIKLINDLDEKFNQVVEKSTNTKELIDRLQKIASEFRQLR
ncbi:MAG: hypothetical protein ACTSRH_00155 [Promethearchaeota archaeon]